MKHAIQMNKKLIVLYLLVLMGTMGCSKKDIVIENTSISPDLSNPIIQKISNQTWYKRPGTAEGQSKLIWESQQNMPSSSESAANLLYSMAFQNITLNRNGTSNMLFVPPFMTHVYIHNSGNWRVAKTEPNALVINTKTPVSNSTAMTKVLKLEAKDQISTLNLSMDFGYRLLEFNFVNKSFVSSDPIKIEAEDFRWFEKQQISTTALHAKDFVGTWASAHFINPVNTAFYGGEYKKEEIIQVSHIEDLLLATPTFFSGQAFDLKADGSASIAYKLFETTLNGVEDEIPDGKTVVSNATWEIKGNKIFIYSDEALFYSLGEMLFHLPVYGEQLLTVGYYGDLPIRIQKGRYYAIELIEKTDQGFWSRITTNDGVFYSFLFLTQLDHARTINIKNAF